MQIAVRILVNTPLWVFALLADLIWQGLQGLRPRTRPIWRTLIVPLVFFLWGLSRLVLARDHGLEPMLAWFVALILFAALGLSLRPKLLSVDREKGTATRPGSFGPLIRNVTVFSDMDASMRSKGVAIRGFVTAEDSKSEEDAVLAANRAIRELDA
jgi:hypothetical protein